MYAIATNYKKEFIWVDRMCKRVFLPSAVNKACTLKLSSAWRRAWAIRSTLLKLVKPEYRNKSGLKAWRRAFKVKPFFHLLGWNEVTEASEYLRQNKVKKIVRFLGHYTWKWKPFFLGPSVSFWIIIEPLSEATSFVKEKRKSRLFFETQAVSPWPLSWPNGSWWKSIWASYPSTTAPHHLRSASSAFPLKFSMVSTTCWRKCNSV